MKHTSEHFRRQVEAVKRRHKEDGRKKGEAMFRDFLSIVNAEIERLQTELRKAQRSAQRVRLQATLAMMEASRDDLYRKFNRKPPESGLGVPAVPPGGPKPRSGGAEAPLTFD